MAARLSQVLAGRVRPDWTVSVVQPDQAAETERASMTDLDERQLVAACLAGRRDAFDLIVERHRRTVYQLCYRFVKPLKPAEAC